MDTMFLYCCQARADVRVSYRTKLIYAIRHAEAPDNDEINHPDNPILSIKINIEDILRGSEFLCLLYLIVISRVIPRRMILNEE
jgi:hypothetical protein